MVSLYATISGCDDWGQIEDYAANYEEELRVLYKKLSGNDLEIARMPSHDTFNRIFQLIDPNKFMQAYKDFVCSIYEIMTGKTIAIDGKTLRGVKRVEKMNPAHIVSAYCPEHHFVIDHLKAEEKGHELTTILKLLDALFLEGSTVTIDAAGTYVEVVEKILSKGGNFVLPVKGNQKRLLRFIEQEFKSYRNNEITTDKQIDTGHGKVEERTAYCITDIRTDDDIDDCMSKWEGVKTLVKIERKVYKKVDKSDSVEIVYYITNLTDAKEINDTIRRHWSIENNLHRSLDVLLGEDHSQKSINNVVENFHIMNLLALFVLKELSNEMKISMKRIRKICSYTPPTKLFT